MSATPFYGSQLIYVSSFDVHSPIYFDPGVAHVVNKVFAKVSKKISKVSKRLGCYAFSFIVCAFSSSFSFFRFVYCASYALICDVIFKPPFYLPYSPFLKRKSDQNKIPADPPLVYDYNTYNQKFLQMYSFI